MNVPKASPNPFLILVNSLKQPLHVTNSVTKDILKDVHQKAFKMLTLTLFSF